MSFYFRFFKVNPIDGTHSFRYNLGNDEIVITNIKINQDKNNLTFHMEIPQYIGSEHFVATCFHNDNHSYKTNMFLKFMKLGPSNLKYIRFCESDYMMYYPITPPQQPLNVHQTLEYFVNNNLMLTKINRSMFQNGFIFSNDPENHFMVIEEHQKQMALHHMINNYNGHDSNIVLWNDCDDELIDDPNYTEAQELEVQKEDTKELFEAIRDEPIEEEDEEQPQDSWFSRVVYSFKREEPKRDLRQESLYELEDEYEAADRKLRNQFTPKYRPRQQYNTSIMSDDEDE